MMRTATMFCGLLGLWWSYQLARHVAPASMASVALATIGGGTFVLWYLVEEPGMSHAVSMASTAAFTLTWLRYRESESWRTWGLVGLLGGVMVMTSWQNVVVLVVPAIGLIRTPQRFAAFAVGAFVGTWPQQWMGLWAPVNPQLLWSGQWMDVLWSSRNGLFATSPAAYAGAIGLILLWRRHRLIALTGLTTLVLMTWLNGAVEDGSAGGGYGGRHFDGLIPFLVCGFAGLASAMVDGIRRRPGVSAAAVLVTLVVWNVTLMAVARSGTYRIGQIVSFGDLSAAQASVAHTSVGHVPSFPANVLWAMANGVTPDRFDVLRPNRFLTDPARPYGLVDIGTAADTDYIGAGWHGPERSGDLTFRWVAADARLVLSLARAEALWVQIQTTPFEAPGLAPQALTLRVNDRELPAVVLASGWQRLDISTDADVWRAGVNHLTLMFSRETRPADVGGTDGRRLAAAIDAIRIQKR
jgi:hypothetical protein